MNMGISMIKFKMEIPSNEEIVKSLKVDDISNELIIKTTYDKDLKSLKLLVKTNSMGSLKNILDDYFINYDLTMKLLEQIRNDS